MYVFGSVPIVSLCVCVLFPQSLTIVGTGELNLTPPTSLKSATTLSTSTETDHPYVFIKKQQSALQRLTFLSSCWYIWLTSNLLPLPTYCRLLPTSIILSSLCPVPAPPPAPLPLPLSATRRSLCSNAHTTSHRNASLHLAVNFSYSVGLYLNGANFLFLCAGDHSAG